MYPSKRRIIPEHLCAALQNNASKLFSCRGKPKYQNYHHLYLYTLTKLTIILNQNMSWFLVYCCLYDLILYGGRLLGTNSSFLKTGIRIYYILQQWWQTLLGSTFKNLENALHYSVGVSASPKEKQFFTYSKKYSQIMYGAMYYTKKH